MSDRAYKLHTSQLSIWTGFEQEVRQETASVFGNPIDFVPPILANEHYVVATESGTSARIVENVFQAIGAVFEAQDLKAVRMYPLVNLRLKLLPQLLSN